MQIILNSKWNLLIILIFPNELIKVVELISQAISDINTAAFIETTINDEDPIDTWIAQAKLRWNHFITLKMNS